MSDQPAPSQPGLEAYGSEVLVVVDSTGRCVQANDAATRVLGLEPADLVGTLLIALIHPDDHPDASRQLSLRRASSSSVYRVHRADGAWRDMELSTSVDIGLGGLVVAMRDVTELNRRSLAIANSARIDDLVRRMSLGFVDLAADHVARAVQLTLTDVGRLTQADRAYVIRFDHPSRTLHLMNEWCAPGISTLAEFRRSIPFDHLARVLDPLFRLEPVIVHSTAELEESDPEDARAMRAEGVRSMAVVPIGGDSGLDLAIGIEAVSADRHFTSEDLVVLGGVGALFTQVMRRAKNDAALIEDVHRLRTVWNGAPVAIAVLDERGAYVQANNAFCQLVGRDSDDVLATHWYEITDLADLGHSEVVTGPPGRTESFTKSYRRADETIVRCRVSARAVDSPDGQPRSVIAVEEALDLRVDDHGRDARRNDDRDDRHDRRDHQSGRDTEPSTTTPVGANRAAPGDASETLANVPDALIRVSRDGSWVALNPVAATFVGAAAQSDGWVDVGALHPDVSGALGPAIRAAFERGSAAAVDVEISDDGRYWQALVVPEDPTIRAPVPSDDTGVINSVLIAGRDLTARRTAESELAHQALHDPLTGLPNRKLFQSHLEHAVAGLVRRPSLTAVLFFDLDKFKSVNDTIGHAVGDELLVVVAQRLRSALRPEDVVARLGGDEFIVLLENLGDPAEAVTAAERLAATLGQPAVLSGHEVSTSASIGIALTSDGNTLPAELVKRADAAMYRAKEKGRGRVEVFDEDLQERVATRLRLSAGLRLAVLNKELEVHYQPEVDLITGDVVALEALLRWRDPHRGLIDAHEFVTHAEELGLLVHLSTQTMSEACRVGAALNRLRPASPLRVHVNVSPRQLHTAGLVESVIEALTRSSLSPRLLNLDITEGVLTSDQSTGRAAIAELTALGVSVVLDAFGTATSSLVQLSRIGLGGVKIDRSVIALLPNDAAARAAVASMVAVAKALDVRVSAVGIETEDQVRALIAIGCSLGQGSLFSMATTAAEFPAW